jgi:hypothetical protein
MSELAPENALGSLAERLRAEDSVISPHVRDTGAVPALGVLVAGGTRTATAPAEYALVIESVREGYLLHYGEPRVVVGADRDLALLAGDYLYALGLERLAGLGDLEAVRELSDLISLSAQLHADGGDTPSTAPLWLAATVAVAVGGGAEHEGAKEALRAGEDRSVAALLEFARSTAARAGIGDPLAVAADSVGFALEDVSDEIG